MDSIELPDHPQSVPASRDHVREVLADHEIASWEAVLVTSELAANVVRHAHTPFTVEVEVISPKQVRIGVWDGAGAERVASDMATDVGGWGLQIVEALAQSWGVETLDHRKQVWVTVRARKVSEEG